MIIITDISKSTIERVERNGVIASGYRIRLDKLECPDVEVGWFIWAVDDHDMGYHVGTITRQHSGFTKFRAELSTGHCRDVVVAFAGAIA